MASISRTPISIGAHCFTAAFLDRRGHRKASGPFDWLFSNPKMVTHCIETQFSMLLDRDQYQAVEGAPKHSGTGVTDHVYYRDTFGVRNVFNHHDPRTAEDHALYVRRSARFMDTIRQEPTLLLMVLRKAPTEVESVSLGRAVDTASLGKAKVLMVHSQENTSRLSPAVVERRVFGTSTLLTFDSVSHLGATAYGSPIDEDGLYEAVREFLGV